MKKTTLTILAALALLALAVTAAAHTPLMSCFDEGDGSITCEGGFSDGSSAAGVEFRLEQKGQVILQTRFNEISEINFKKPAGDFQAVFDGGEGHVVTIDGKRIF